MMVHLNAMWIYRPHPEATTGVRCHSYFNNKERGEEVLLIKEHRVTIEEALDFTCLSHTSCEELAVGFVSDLETHFRRFWIKERFDAIPRRDKGTVVLGQF